MGWWCVCCTSGHELPSGLPGHTLLTDIELLLTSTPRSFSAGLLSSCMSFNLYLTGVLFHPDTSTSKALKVHRQWKFFKIVHILFPNSGNPYLAFKASSSKTAISSSATCCLNVETKNRFPYCVRRAFPMIPVSVFWGLWSPISLGNTRTSGNGWDTLSQRGKRIFTQDLAETILHFYNESFILDLKGKGIKIRTRLSPCAKRWATGKKTFLVKERVVSGIQEKSEYLWDLEEWAAH